MPNDLDVELTMGCAGVPGTFKRSIPSSPQHSQYRWLAPTALLDFDGEPQAWVQMGVAGQGATLFRSLQFDENGEANRIVVHAGRLFVGPTVDALADRGDLPAGARARTPLGSRPLVGAVLAVVIDPGQSMPCGVPFCGGRLHAWASSPRGGR